MEKNNPSSKVVDNDVDITGMHLSEIADAFIASDDKEEVIVNEQEQNEVTNQEEDPINGTDTVIKKDEDD